MFKHFFFPLEVQVEQKTFSFSLPYSFSWKICDSSESFVYQLYSADMYKILIE